MACGMCHLILNFLSTSFQASGVVVHLTYSPRNSSWIALHTFGTNLKTCQPETGMIMTGMIPSGQKTSAFDTNLDIEDLPTRNWYDNDWCDSPVPKKHRVMANFIPTLSGPL